MSELPALGRFTVVPLREVWKHEAHQFTQWLLQNADVLADVLGMDLELDEAEYRVGGFALDLIGRDMQTGEQVIIENQLEQTDHTHLGQLLTYAGGTKAKTIVWCAASFRDEHRAALDWLNENTIEEIRFFGVEIAAVRIGESTPAPQFRLVVKPNDWTKRVQGAEEASSATGRSLAYEALWATVLQTVTTKDRSWTRARAAQPVNWMTLPFGMSSAWYHFVYADGVLRVELYFGSADAELNARQFSDYSTQRSQIENDFGGSLEFLPLPERKSCRIQVTSDPGWDIFDHSQYPAMAQWFVDTFSCFRAATQAAKKRLENVPSL